MGVPADLGAKINIRKRAIRIDPDVMEDISMEWGNKRDWVSLKVGDIGDETEEIVFDEFFLGNPKLFSTVVNNSVLVGMSVDSEGTDRGVEEVGEEIGYRLLR